ncbi:hypothetical protein D1AOALGA4SA_9397 [Olavius algarvensis Delta 1 endosymbiont]|nr:hypothetical protein D1AOALGA4SA_9397 [Olavius algarvensis Delta 1 endosymbiont]
MEYWIILLGCINETHHCRIYNGRDVVPTLVAFLGMTPPAYAQGTTLEEVF